MPLLRSLIIASAIALLPGIALAESGVSKDSCSSATVGDWYCECDTPTTPIYESADTSDDCNAACGTYPESDSWTLYQCLIIDGEATADRYDQGNVTAEANDYVTGTSDVDSGSGATAATERRDAIIPELNVDIPGLEFSTPTGENGMVQSNFLGEYIVAVYQFALVAGAIIAVVMLMIGGLQYALARGNSDYTKKGKTRITNAITGIILLLMAYNIAYLIDPRLLRLNPLSISYIEKVAYIEDSGDVTGAVTTTTPPDDIICDPSESLTTIAASFIGNVTYRMGGKGGPPPYEDKVTKVDSTGRPFREYCPEGQLCLDCSGFVAYVAQCAGLGSAGESGGTKGIFSNAERVTDCQATTMNGTALQPGDLLGWPTTDEQTGHVFMYLGDGKVIDSSAGKRLPGKAVGQPKNTAFFCDYADTYTLYVKRRSQ